MDDWQFFMNPIVADLDGDNKVEVVNTSGGYRVHAWNSDAEQPAGWPKSTGGWNITSPAVGDLDGDGTFDVVVASRNGWLFSWSTPGSTDGIVEWQFFGHDHHNTNNYNTPIPIYGTSGSGPSEREDTPIEGEDAGVAEEDAETPEEEIQEGADTEDSTGEGASEEEETEVAAGVEGAGGGDGGCHHGDEGSTAFMLLLLLGAFGFLRRGEA
jgi:MYXO-CTERM domain-containing protein